ncbi:glycerophosphodiester phosphodiesterase family protein [Monashia sp. NPDC004114]
MSQADRRVGPWASGRFDIEGHRGAKGLVVENTLSSFRAAFDAGVTGVELDVRLTADRQLVVWHDPMLLPLKCLPTGPDLIGAHIADLTLAQLRTVDVGSQVLPGFPGQAPAPGAWISTLREVLTFGLERAPDVWWTIELKVNPLDAREVAGREVLLDGVLDTVHDLGLQWQCFVHSFDWSVLELSARVAPHVARSALVEADVTWVQGSPWTGGVRFEDHGDDVCGAVAELGAHVISPEHIIVDRALVDQAHDLGLSVLPWTVNDPARMRAMVDAGVDGLVSDYPDRAIALIGAVAPASPSDPG